MPTPSPEPTPAQIVTVAEIAMVTVDEVVTMIAANSSQDIVDAQWAATLLDIASWTTGGVGRDAGDVKRIDQIEFFESGASNARLEIRNAVRMRYGLPFMTSEEASQSSVTLASLNWISDCYGRVR